MNLTGRNCESIGLHLLLLSIISSRHSHTNCTLNKTAFYLDKRLNILLPVPLKPMAKSFYDLSLITFKEVHQFYEVTNKKKI